MDMPPQGAPTKSFRCMAKPSPRRKLRGRLRNSHDCTRLGEATTILTFTGILRRLFSSVTAAYSRWSAISFLALADRLSVPASKASRMSCSSAVSFVMMVARIFVKELAALNDRVQKTSGFGSGTGVVRASMKAARAKAKTARRSSRVTCGYSARILCVLQPDAIRSMMNASRVLCP